MMRALILLFIVLVPGGALIYGLGCWLLGEKPWDLWRDALPDMYDGKEPYEQWQAKMEIARRLQDAEERKDD